jgi:hypothetical protein
MPIASQLEALLETFATIRTSFSVAPENGASQSIKQMSRTLRVRNGVVTSVDYGSGVALFHRRADSGAGEKIALGCAQASEESRVTQFEGSGIDSGARRAASGGVFSQTRDSEFPAAVPDASPRSRREMFP